MLDAVRALFVQIQSDPELYAVRCGSDPDLLQVFHRLTREEALALHGLIQQHRACSPMAEKSLA